MPLYHNVLRSRNKLHGSVFETLWGRFSPLRARPDGLRGPLNLLYNGYRCSFLRVNRQGWALTTHLYLAASFILGTAELLLTLWTFKASQAETIIIHVSKSNDRHTVIFNRFELRNALTPATDETHTSASWLIVTLERRTTTHTQT
jgi:hypothetical protein